MATIGLVDVFGAPTGAQSADIAAELVSVDADGTALSSTNTRPSVSDDGNTIVFTALGPAVGADPAEHDLVVRRRSADAAATGSLLLPVGSVDPLAAAVSGDGCTVAYSTVVPRPEPAGDAEQADDAEPADDAGQVDDAELVDDAEAAPEQVDTPEQADDAEQVGAAVDDAGVDDAGADEAGPDEAGDPGVAGGAAGAGVAAAAQVAAGDVIELRSVDVCGAAGIEPVTTVLDRIDAADPARVVPLAAPALSVDGSTIAFATRPAVLVYEAGSTPEQPAFVSIPAPGADFAVGDRLDVTADGSIVVFEAGPLSADVAAADAIDSSVHLATIAPAGGDQSAVVAVDRFAPSDAGSTWPSISADGALVAYQSDQRLPIDGIPAEGNYIVLAERSAAGTTHRFLVDAAARPDLAANGAAIAYDVFGSVQVRRSESVVPFVDFSEQIVNARVDVDFVEGAGESVSGVALSGDGSSVVFDQPAGAALSTPTEPGAHVWAQATDPLFAPPPTSTTIDNTTTTTTVAVTQPTVAPNTTRNTTPRNTTRTTPRNTTRITPRNTTRITAPATVAPASQQVAFTPAAFEFAPTIITAGRRTASVELTNPTTDSVSVTSVVVDAAGGADFTIDSTACTVLAQRAGCAVIIDFTPTAVGERTTTVVATLSDGSTATLALRGLGAPEPTLDVLPGVASNGQVVAVIGSGFPAGATVEFSWNNDVVTSRIVVDDQGGFSETRVVLPNTTAGPIELSVAAQTDLFGEVVATLLVSDSSSRGNTAVLGGGINGASLGR